MRRYELEPVVERAWSAFDNAIRRGVAVEPSIPVLFFGDLAGYGRSPFKVVTVGLNPSNQEFPAAQPYRRFPGAAGASVTDIGPYTAALSDYFRVKPYGWFCTYEQVLNGAGVSYWPGAVSAALHTDICTPVATSPTWSRLDEHVQGALMSDGPRLWRDLMTVLRPDVIVASVKREYLAHVLFPALGDFEVIHTVTRTGDGLLRRQPYEVIARWHDVDGHPSMLVFGQAAQTPFGKVIDPEKHTSGERIVAHYCATRP